MLYTLTVPLFIIDHFDQFMYVQDSVTWFVNVLVNQEKRIMVGFGLFLEKLSE